MSLNISAPTSKKGAKYTSPMYVETKTRQERLSHVPNAIFSGVITFEPNLSLSLYVSRIMRRRGDDMNSNLI